ncbi:uncharacterized protein LOC107227669 isoform X1 [Neodiprion lecontei]|uniref:Uncharacterized protein LOC107227669 isoform X1 n=1 Tax=Neodiprion lecontei TaxID=441921 RepID=A0ABM3GPW7_NEOLC|nr:uncharacterized protein LOC107227669 isoform X1 [Neodiprion lecontei]XP_046602311.1 uncharacterized protein LOC107227669 isoform X1 [Neodiprion lecontei]XP_046602312.1 uncharacterized protein LOC107227669 isoform X1 [Neodiprion lecontei]
MPKVRQPAVLQKMALDVIFEYVVLCCDRTSIEGSLDELNQVISAIKLDVISCIPWFSVADFSARFLERFYSDSRPASHLKAALEVVMDTEIVGLQCRGPILAYLDPQDGSRLRRLAELDLDYILHSLPINLPNFYLNDLTSFVFAERCTNLDLSVVGRNCPKLQIVRVPESRHVTDEGLSNLSQCSDLRFIDVYRCSVTHSGINRMLAVHKKLDRISNVSAETLFHLDSSVCPSISHFSSIPDTPISSANLRKIVTKFPNITYLHVHGVFTEEFSILNPLNKLTGLDFTFSSDMYYDEIEIAWVNIKEFLLFVGANLTTLKLACWEQGFLWRQEDVDFIFDSCPNLECLKFDHGDGLVVIPSFQKLKVLIPHIAIEFESIELLRDPMIEFDKLPSLETLSLHNYDVSFQTIQSIMLDNDRFPKLSVIETICMKDEDLEEIRRIARMKNLDFEIKNDPCSNWYNNYRFNTSSPPSP